VITSQPLSVIESHPLWSIIVNKNQKMIGGAVTREYSKGVNERTNEWNDKLNDIKQRNGNITQRYNVRRGSLLTMSMALSENSLHLLTLSVWRQLNRVK
jgi:hypothetical protein